VKALVLADFYDLQVLEVDRPTLEPHDALVRILYTGICGSDIHGYTGENGRRRVGQIMGHETVGILEELGADVAPRGISLGSLVTINPLVVSAEDLLRYPGREQHAPSMWVLGVRADRPAAFAQYTVIPAANLVPVGELDDPRVGALIEPLAVAIHAVARALEKCCADSALIIGGGPIGQMLNIALARVGVNSRTQVEPHEARRSVCCSLGACAIDPAALERDILAGRRWPVVFDAVGASQTLESALAAADVGGTVCLVGMHSPTLTVDAYAISTQERTVVGSFVYSRMDFDAAAAYSVEQGARLVPLIDSVVSLEEAPAEFARLAADGTAAAARVLVDMTPPLDSL